MKALARRGAHLVLAGHTHGGQWCLPGGRPMFTHDTLPRQTSGGMTRMGDTWLHVSRGLGCSKWNLRLWCPPEMTVITLQPA